MAGARNAQYLVRETRNLVGIKALDKLADGFPKDRNTADLSILPAINHAITELLASGIIKCRFALRATAGKAEYRLDPGIGLIESVRYRGRLLEKTNLMRDARRMGGAVGYSGPSYVLPWGPTGAPVRSGTPSRWYNDVSDVLGLLPAPSITDTTGAPLTDPYPSIEVLAEALADDLVNPEDIPDRIPSQFHEDIPVGAARWLLLSTIGSTDTDSDGPEPSDPQSAGVDALALKLQYLTGLWGTPDDAVTVGTTHARLRRFAQQRDQSETVQLSPPPRRAPGWV